ncbi:MAG: hypothetical protein HON94_11565 [Methylococcales bacterium]|jgi:hypothetical protein|nr:hypothetical protein [Methylococcales bacterium]
MKIKKTCIYLCMASGFLFASNAFSCGIEGSAHRTGGSKVNGTATISTSWNGDKAFPRNGQYQLDLGSSVCGKKLTVFVNGYKIGRYRIPSSGYATVNFTLKGSSDYPVR